MTGDSQQKVSFNFLRQWRLSFSARYYQPHYRLSLFRQRRVMVAAIVAFFLGAGLMWCLEPLIPQLPLLPPHLLAPWLPTPDWLTFEQLMADNPSSIQTAVAPVLHLTPAQVKAQLRQGKSLTAIASARGISASQLRNTELHAFHQTLQDYEDHDHINADRVDAWMYQLDFNSSLLDQETIRAFMPPS